MPEDILQTLILANKLEAMLFNTASKELLDNSKKELWRELHQIKTKEWDLLRVLIPG